MCGIVGYTGGKKAISEIVEQLKLLEYRGYDSSGIAFQKDNKIGAVKSLGNISKLMQKTPKDIESNCIISHTRWATHGGVKLGNAHPLVSQGGKWAVVHNGIIENYAELKCGLNSPLDSETDTAVVVQMLEEKNVSGFSDFVKTLKDLKGSFAILAIKSTENGVIYLAKNKSPLYVALSKGNVLVASDPICFVGFSDKCFVLEDGIFGRVCGGAVEFCDCDFKKVCCPELDVSAQKHDFDMGKNKYFMLKEIMEEKDVLLRLAKESGGELVGLDGAMLSCFDNVKLIGCGTAYHAGLIGAKYFEQIDKIPATCEIASEFVYSNPLISTKTLYIFVSQSGETADTIRALKMVKSSGAFTIALTNVEHSTLARIADKTIMVFAGAEIAVASTKAYVCQVATLYLMAKHFLGEDGRADVRKLAKSILAFDREKIDRIAEKIKGKKQAIFIGKNYDYVTGLEGALKLKEITYINATGHPSGELKHGYLAMIEKGYPVLAIACDEKINIKTINSLNEAKTRGAEIFEITSDGKTGENVVRVVAPNVYLMPLASVVPLQYLAYLVCIKKGLNPDQPRNLAKSVTVE